MKKLVVLMAPLFVLLLIQLPAEAGSTVEHHAQIKALQTEMADLKTALAKQNSANDELKGMISDAKLVSSSNFENTEKQTEKYRLELSYNTKKIKTIDVRIDNIDSSINNIDVKIEEIDRKIDDNVGTLDAQINKGITVLIILLAIIIAAILGLFQYIGKKSINKKFNKVINEDIQPKIDEFENIVKARTTANQPYLEKISQPILDSFKVEADLKIKTLEALIKEFEQDNQKVGDAAEAHEQKTQELEKLEQAIKAINFDKPAEADKKELNEPNEPAELIDEQKGQKNAIQPYLEKISQPILDNFKIEADLKIKTLAALIKEFERNNQKVGDAAEVHEQKLQELEKLKQAIKTKIFDKPAEADKKELNASAELIDEQKGQKNTIQPYLEKVSQPILDGFKVEFDHKIKTLAALIKEFEQNNQKVGDAAEVHEQKLQELEKLKQAIKTKNFDKPAEAEVDKKELNEYKELIDEVKEEKDQTADDWFNKGLSAHYDDPDIAINYYTKAIELDPEDSDAYTNRGILFKNQERYEEAKKDDDKAIELNPDSAENYYNRAILLEKLIQYEEAEKDYTKAIELAPDSAETYYNRAILFEKLMQYEEAEKDYTKAIELNPTYTDAYTNRGILFEELGRNEEAEKDYNKAIELNSDNVDRVL